MEYKLKKLIETIKGLDPLIIAFSGGVDSSFLAAFSKKMCNVNAIAVTITTQFQSQKEYNTAIHMGKKIGIPHAFVELDLLKHKNIVNNGRNRCYFCKKAIFQAIRDYGKHIGIANIVHGANMDDLNDFRPGFQAAQEMKIKAPLIEACMTKEHIRHYSKKMELDSWNMPSQSCLATRIQYNTIISSKKLNMIEESEQYLESLGFENFRVRCHGDMARIEFMPESIDRIGEKMLRRQIVDKLKEIGFLYIAVDLEGYVPGSMNRSINDY